MSYILEALRKAEAERQRGVVPGLHAQALPAAELPAGRGGSGRLRLAFLAGLLLLGAAVGVWWWSGARAPEPTSAAVPAPPAVAPVTSSTVAPAAPAPAPVAAPAALPTPPAVPMAPPTATAVPLATVPAPTAPPVARPSPGPAPTPAAPAATAAAPPASPTTQEPPLRLADLPEARRRELPPLAVSGAVQSPDPAARMLIIDGQVLREGDAAAPGLVLERITPRAAVFSQRGQRFEVPL